MDETSEPSSEQQSPEGRERYDAAMRRCKEIEDEIQALPLDANYPEQFVRLKLESLELLESVSPISESAALAAQKANWIAVGPHLKAAWKPQKEPTPAELEMMAFADQLANRQGTHMPDFEALYRQRADLERKLDEPGSEDGTGSE